MNQNEYIKNKCSKCKNKLNEQDLCNITRSRISGNWQCENFEEKGKQENERK